LLNRNRQGAQDLDDKLFSNLNAMWIVILHSWHLSILAILKVIAGPHAASRTLSNVSGDPTAVSESQICFPNGALLTAVSIAHGS